MKLKKTLIIQIITFSIFIFLASNLIKSQDIDSCGKWVLVYKMTEFSNKEQFLGGDSVKIVSFNEGVVYKNGLKIRVKADSVKRVFIKCSKKDKREKVR